MKTSRLGLYIIKRWEGFRSKRYLCAAGYPTIGYGHVIKKGEDYDTREITVDEAEALLIRDIGFAESAVKRLIRVELSQYQFDALVSFTFNLGAANLQSSTLRSKLNRGEYEDAAKEFPKWKYAKGKPLRGLLSRRLEEQAAFRGHLNLINGYDEVDDNGQQF